MRYESFLAGLLLSVPLSAASPSLQERSPAGAPETSRETSPTVHTALTGIVLSADRAPAPGAVVVSSAGGRTVTDERGRFWLEIELPLEATSIQVAARSLVDPASVASARVAVGGSGAPVHTGALSLSSSCQPSWVPTFGADQASPTEAFAIYDDGSGPALIAGDMKWDGEEWQPLGPGVNKVRALAVFDDGSGPALYAGGGFTTGAGGPGDYIARWNGTSWSALGSGMANEVLDLVVWDDGSGPALYAGGSFFSAGGVPANRVAKWDGTSWSALGAGVGGGLIEALAVYDDGSGEALYAGGYFTTAAGSPAPYIAKWDGATWSAVGSGFDKRVRALTVFDDGTGPVLCAGGDFLNAGSTPTSRIARWDGTSWSPFGAGFNARVRALRAFDDGSGPALYAGGEFTVAGGVVANRVARWKGSWSALAGGRQTAVYALTVFDDGSGSGPKLHVGHASRFSESFPVSTTSKWSGTSWSDLPASGVGFYTFALTTFDAGSGPDLYAAGSFVHAGQVEENFARWDGSAWSSLGKGYSEPVEAMTVFDDGGGPALYLGGRFSTAGNVSVDNFARWDGNTWSSVGGVDYRIYDLAVFDDGGGPKIYAGGEFLNAGGGAARNVARWNGGTSWSRLGSGAVGGWVTALAVYDDGSGPALYAGGTFTSMGGNPSNHIARWNGTAWSAVGSGTTGPYGFVFCMEVLDDGNGPALYVGGNFSAAGGVPASNIARYDGTWSALGAGTNGNVTAMEGFDDGSGPALFVGGAFFTTAGGVAANNLAKWDGSSWSALGSGVTYRVDALFAYDPPGAAGPALVVGGQFRQLESFDENLALWQGCLDTFPPLVECPPTVLKSDTLGSPPGETVTFSVVATDNSDLSPTVVCLPPSGSFFPPGTTLVTCTATDASGNQSSCSFPVVVVRKVR